eukprot:TRINITY_DN245_c0_g2_i1.p1 TRINITY_DN245_c0_g2~~TRINITY_DN245_c0_g2_i1.p1  ORF type:complete len:723 (-),score=164.06 TRINITY_DN245_c0_g2_i1:38-2206(-)
MEIFVQSRAMEELDEEEREDMYPFFPTDRQLEERSYVLSFADLYRRIEAEKRHEGEKEEEGSCVDPTNAGEEEEEEDEEDHPSAKKFLEDVRKCELEDPSLFDVSQYYCNCGKDCVKKLPRARFVRLVYSFQKMNSIGKRQFITYTLLPYIVYPTDEEIADIDGEKRPTKRRKRSGDDSKRHASVTYVLGRTKMCRIAFRKLLNISDRNLTIIIRNICAYDGGVPDIFDLRKGRKTRKTDKKEYVIDFLRRYGEEHGYPCPSSRPPGGNTHVNEDIIVLPSGTEKRAMYHTYVTAIFDTEKEELDREKREVVLGREGDDGAPLELPESDADVEWDDGWEPTSYNNFVTIWKKFCPWLRIAAGRSDLCDLCSRFERDKMEGWDVVVRAHKLLGSREREFYRRSINLSSVQHGSLHLTFDFAQCVRIPHSMQQAGNIYFKSPYKIDLFGIAAEAEMRTEVYCIPEGHYADASPKGPNYVIGMLDHYLSQEWLAGVRQLRLHADNCLGQNKNKYVLAYLAYLVANGRFDSITLAFMVTGHTKCSVDGVFGLIKRTFWNTERVEIPEEFMDVVNKSCYNARPVYMEGYKWRNWKEFLDQFKLSTKMTKKQHVFVFERSQPLTVRGYKWSCDLAKDPAVQYQIFSGISDPHSLVAPEEHGFIGIDAEKFAIRCEGLSDERKEQLYNVVDMNCTPTAKLWYEEKFQLAEAFLRRKGKRANKRGEKQKK